jgi:hypothetical protein
VRGEGVAGASETIWRLPLYLSHVANMARVGRSSITGVFSNPVTVDPFRPHGAQPFPSVP